MNDRLAVALIEAWLRIGQILSRHHDAFLDQEGLVVLGLRALEQLRFRGNTSLRGLIGRNRLIDQPEGQLGGLAEQLLQPRGILQARHLHQNAVDALALDRRLDRAELVDAPLDDLDRLLDRLADALDDRRRGRRQPEEATADVGDLDGALAGSAEHAAERLRQIAQLAERK